MAYFHVRCGRTLKTFVESIEIIEVYDPKVDTYTSKKKKKKKKRNAVCELS